ncbi:MAG: TIGR03936 family radical SAM-associated protein [Actinobacteria bacterium]|nr:TIGR03936 family radical SAM-associated protein [Actinomycetota bacterium]
MQRIRVKYAKRGRLRFTSHRDFSRALERAVRRSRIPIAYSSGFTPHPRISYAGASPTGVASEAEYLEMALQDRVDLAEVLIQLDQALPIGLDVIEIVEATTSEFAATLEASEWHFSISAPAAITDQIPGAIATFLAADEVMVERMSKNGLRRFDVRSAVLSLADQAPPEVPEVLEFPEFPEFPKVTDGNSTTMGERALRSAILEAVIRHGSPSVRPDDLLAALRIEGLASRAIVTRLAQGPFDERAGAVTDPFGPDRK